MKFVDYTSISIKAGDGGDGCIAFLREKFRPKGGPAGGDGGHGGDVYFQVSSDLSTLSDLNYKKHYFAGDGENGKGKNMHGKNGEDIFIRVPQGTIVIDSITKQRIVDLVKNNQTYKIASGGNGGLEMLDSKLKKLPLQELQIMGKKVIL